MSSGDLITQIHKGVVEMEGELCDICSMGTFARLPDDITAYKNGDSAHLDLMISQYIIKKFNETMRSL